MLELFFPMLALISIGWIFRRLNLISENADRILNDYVYYVALPATMVIKLAGIRLGIEHVHLLALTSIPIVLVILLAVALWKTGALKPNMAGALLVCGFFGNVGFLGFPAVQLRYGSDALADAAVVLVAYNLFLFGAGFIILEWMTKTGDWKFVKEKLSKNTVIHSCLFGLFLSLAGITLPSIVAEVLQSLSNTTIPVALFSVGVFLCGKKLNLDLRRLSMLIGTKMVLFPLALLACAYLIVPLRGQMLGVSFMEAIMPIGVINLAIAQKFGLDEKLVAESIVASTILFLPLFAGYGLISALLPS